MATMSTKRHLRELQWRFMIVAAFFIIGALCAYTFRDTLIPLLMAPLHGERLIYLNPAGGFSFIFLVSVYAGIALSIPVLIQQLYGFLKPALPSSAHKKSAKLVFGSLLLLAAGISFGYFVAVPNALAFLYSFADQYVQASLTADSYLNFIVAYTVGIGIVFQVPLVLMLVHSVKPLSPGGLMRSQKWVILTAFVVAAIITPTPDPVNQTIIAIPVIVIYQLGVIAVMSSIYKAHRLNKKAAKQALRIQQAQRKQAALTLAPVFSQANSLMPELAFIAAPIPGPAVAVESAVAAEEQNTQPHTATKQYAPVAHKASPQIRSLEGFRRVHKNTASAQPQLAQERHVRTVPQPIQRVKLPLQRSFSMDGISVTRRATSY